MVEDYDWDTYEILKEQLIFQLPKIEFNILNLEHSEHVADALDNLFDIFHSYQTTSKYLNLKPLYQLTLKAETIISSLQSDIKIVQESIVEW